MGFSGCTAPGVTLETHEIPQLNTVWKHHHYSGATVDPITLSRGVRADDDSMWDWVEKAIHGQDVPYRDLMLVHSTEAKASFTDRAVVGLAAGLVNPIAGVAALHTPDSYEARLIPGRLWILWETIPIAYKSGTDFDATSAEVSIMELTIQPRAINEFALAKQVPFLGV